MSSRVGALLMDRATSEELQMPVNIFEDEVVANIAPTICLDVISPDGVEILLQAILGEAVVDDYLSHVIFA